MAAMNSSVLACNYAISGSAGSSELNAKIVSVSTPAVHGHKMPVIRAQQVDVSKESRGTDGRRAAMALLAVTLFTTATAAASSSANAGVIDEYLERSKANKELNDQKRLATSGANFARAYTVQFGTCKKCHSSRMIWNWSAKGKINTSVVPMFSGNGEVGQLISLNILFYPPMYLSFH
ncbi:hypothetical protein CISIN_1g029577mg [Citrus sinensis]|uniref:Uncharacterized protein n=1 Tax=Citrus sinensis TaxID=2711 RepID=A0A067EGH9_CITSI|nr:hypothetical protein CISIN_1g029577mg [Citrus sinensis]